ncbi:MAG: hypothetical protein HZC28_17460 [Spirochaetes bacterium]|nr:hypothetical protein [Spirochaetota bacterium]
MIDIAIRGSHPGGNIILKSIEGDTVTLAQDLRDTNGTWFYWNFRIEHAAEKTLTFKFDEELIGHHGPAVSRDGIRWDWAKNGVMIDRKSFRYTFGPDDNSFYFAFCMPYTAADLQRFLGKHADDPRLSLKILTKTEAGYSAPLLLMGNRDKPEKHMVITARHHACESTASYMIEGIIDYFLSNPKLLDKVLFHIVPFADYDGVEHGDQGKSRIPHDHNRDYIDAPLYKTVESIIRHCGDFPVFAGFDLHAPYKWGGRNDFPFIAKSASPGKEEIERFGAYLKTISASRGGLVYDGTQDIEAGVEWNLNEPSTCSSFMRRSGAKLAFTFEMPYFGIAPARITQQGLRNFGKDFAAAIESYYYEVNT